MDGQRTVRKPSASVNTAHNRQSLLRIYVRVSRSVRSEIQSDVRAPNRGRFVDPKSLAGQSLNAYFAGCDGGP